MALKHNHEKPIERDRERRYQHAGKEQNILLMGFLGSLSVPIKWSYTVDDNRDKDGDNHDYCR